MNQILPIASGKGGVGKSLFTANLGVALAGLNKTVILVDLDLGASNLHTFLGVRNKQAGIGNIIYKKEKNLEAVICGTEINRLFLIPGDGLYPGTANIPYYIKEKIIRELRKLVADYIIIDLGAGSSYNILDFYLASSSGFLVITPETTSVLNAYSFLKSALFRLIYRAYKPRSEERKIITDFMSQKLEGSEKNISDVIEYLNSVLPGSGETASNLIGKFFPRIIINMAKSQSDADLGIKLRTITRSNLNVEMEYFGWLPYDANAPLSLLKRMPLAVSAPGSPYVAAVNRIAGNIIASHFNEEPILYEADEDLISLAQSI